MELIEIGNRTWQKYKGDEGQDVYIAMFLEDQDDMLGKYADDTDYDILIDGDADFYLPPECDMTKSISCDQKCFNCMDEDRVAFKFRKNVFTPEEQKGAYDGLYGSAVESNNRGLAAGPREESQGKRDWVTGFQQDILSYYEMRQPQSVDGSDPLELIKKSHEKGKDEIRGGVWLRTKVEPVFGTYTGFFPKVMDLLASLSIEDAAAEAANIRKTMVSSTSYATALWSGIAGFYGRYPRIPYGRATSFTDHHRETFEKCYPFARKLDKKMSELLPDRYGFQKKCADSIDKKFLIGEDTTFTTITVNTTESNRNARMACHRDAGSLNEGFSNLTVISDGNKGWKGGYLVAPQCRVAINVLPGDLLLIDNMRVIHGNTPIEEPDEGEMLRMSLVFYFREDMLELGSWKYEHLRKQYVDDRRLDESHPKWRPYWNGVSPGMWHEQEWFDYLENTGGRKMVEEYHPIAYEEVATLEAFL